MNGKELKVVEYNLTFGTSARVVNVISLFKYKKNNNIYIIYSDINSSYDVIYYGSSHIKDNTVLSMECKDKMDEEIIKEFIFKTTNKEELNDYEIISLDKIDGLEIISSNKIEIKKEVLKQLIDLTIPKKEIPKNDIEQEKKNKKSKIPLIILMLLLVILATFGFLFLNKPRSNNTEKIIICEKEYNHETLPATINEIQTFNFNINDSLESININQEYTFNTETDYLDFINEGTYYKYIPEENIGNWDKDDENFIFKTTKKEMVKTGYDKPTEYEEVLSYYKAENYTCKENNIE